MKAVLIASFALALTAAAGAQQLPGTKPLTMDGDLAAQMVAGIDKFCDRELAASIERRAAKWHRDFASPEAYVKSIEPNRERFKRIIGAQDKREPVEMTIINPTSSPPSLLGKGAGGLGIADSKDFTVYAVRWNVFKGLDGEGLLLEPKKKAVANIVALPDCDWTPEQLVGLAPGVPKESQFARRLAENGCRVIVPVLIDRKDTWSGNPAIRMTNQPHREFVYRAAFEMGRHIIGFEVQKVLAAVDWFSGGGSAGASPSPLPIGVIGYGEGGLIAFYSAACDVRIRACGVSGYFGHRERLWREPIYRNVQGLLDEFGDAEIASLIAPRALIVESSQYPNISGPPSVSGGRSGAAPGLIVAMAVAIVEGEFGRFKRIVADLRLTSATIVVNDSSPFHLLNMYLQWFNLRSDRNKKGVRSIHSQDPALRAHRQFTQLVDTTQRLLREGEARRAELWSKVDSPGAGGFMPKITDPEQWRVAQKELRDTFWDEVIGQLPKADKPMNPRSRLVYDEPKYRGYEVVLDVWDDVFAQGILLLPKDVKPGERRPVVVCQHGLEGRPSDVADPKKSNPAYNQYACRLAERGFVVFAPQNPYIGGDKFRVLQRKLNPLGKTLFSVITAQHEVILNWLATQPFVDKDRIAFYGLSYGGKTAMRVPALLAPDREPGAVGYCLSICSADYNDWIQKNASTTSKYSYMFTGEYEIFEWNLGNTFNYAEMSWLICPRPFMVERGHHDGVAPDDWVASEFAKTRRRYDLLGIGDRCAIEFFNGPHTIHGVGTFKFLHKHLNWPEPKDMPIVPLNR